MVTLTLRVVEQSSLVAFSADRRTATRNHRQQSRRWGQGAGFPHWSDTMQRATTSQMTHICADAAGQRTDRGFSGNSAALRAGCRLADPAAVDQAAVGVALAFLALPRRTRKASQQMRAALVPYVAAVAP